MIIMNSDSHIFCVICNRKMSLTEAVVVSDTAVTLTDEETWQALLERWPSLTETEKWDSFLKYTMGFHYGYIFNHPSAPSSRYHIVPDGMRETCEAAVLRTLHMLRTDFIPTFNAHKEGDYDDQNDSDCGSDNGDVYRSIVRSVQPEAERNYVRFAESLPYCVPLDLGSYRSFPFDKKVVLKWHCPCNYNKFAKFRTMFRISHSLEWNCRDRGFLSLDGLLNHLNSKIHRFNDYDESKVLHLIVNCFIREKYNRW
jgi:hypothetical protein